MTFDFNLYFKKHKINKAFMYRIAFVLVFALVPFISSAKADYAGGTAGSQSRPIDPLKAGEFARKIDEYLPDQFYIDPDFVVLNEMQKGNYTMAQKLAVNQGKNVGPERPSPVYDFKDGDTIESVASKFSLHAGSILDASHIAWQEANHIHAGTILSIPSSDTNTSDDWKKYANDADEQKKQEQARQDSLARRTVIPRSTSSIRNTVDSAIATGLKVIGYSSEQCVPWARENSDVAISGYAGSVQPNAYEPKIGAVALDAFVGHASVVVGIGDDYIVVHEANWVRGKITERTVSKSAIRGYVY